MAYVESVCKPTAISGSVDEIMVAYEELLRFYFLPQVSVWTLT